MENNMETTIWGLGLRVQGLGFRVQIPTRTLLVPSYMEAYGP